MTMERDATNVENDPHRRNILKLSLALAAFGTAMGISGQAGAANKVTNGKHFPDTQTSGRGLNFQKVENNRAKIPTNQNKGAGPSGGAPRKKQ